MSSVGEAGIARVRRLAETKPASMGQRFVPPNKTGTAVMTTSPNVPGRTRYEQLTALRFFAALLVMISHAAMLPRADNALSWFGRHVIDYGHGRVGFFFMLSGFVLCHAYESKLLQGQLSYWAFVTRRFLRIWPLHILVAVPLAAWLLWRTGAADLPVVLVNFLLLQSWVPVYDYYASLNAPSWSLSAELFLYTVFPLLVRISPRYLRIFAVMLVLWSFVAPAILALCGYGHVMNPDGTVGFGYWFTGINPLMRLTEFVIGMVLCRFVRSKEHYSLPVWADSVALLAFVGSMVLFSSLRSVLPDVFLNQAFYLPGLTFLVLALAEGRGGTSHWLARQRTLRFLGESSFALYIIHGPVLRRGFDLYYRFHEPMPLLAFTVLLLAGCVATGCIVHLYVEMPLQRAVRTWLDRPTPRATFLRQDRS